MVGSLGFSEAFGLLSVAGVPQRVAGAGHSGSRIEGSSDTARREPGDLAIALLRIHGEQLDALATRLLEREFLSGDELKALLGSDLTLLTLAVRANIGGSSTRTRDNWHRPRQGIRGAVAVSRAAVVTRERARVRSTRGCVPACILAPSSRAFPTSERAVVLCAVHAREHRLVQWQSTRLCD
jgi:hypothetical protein